MNIFTAFAMAAAAAVVFSLVSGIASMAYHGQINHRTSETWMGWRVALQAAALLFIALAILAPARADTQRPVQRECVYDYRLLTDHECRVYRSKVVKAKSDEERLALRNDLHKVMDARATERGISTWDWRGRAVQQLRTTDAK